MKLTYLGTAAAEGFPAVFCKCRFCDEARRLGGKNIRTRSQALVNDDLLIDFPADSYWHFVSGGIEADNIENLLITHGHSDHFYPRDLFTRRPPYARGVRKETLQVFCPQSIIDSLSDMPKNVTFTALAPYDTVKVGDYEVTPLPARHMLESDALFYIIKGEKTLLYAHDTGYFYDEVLDHIKDKGIRFDMISLDCTNVDDSIPDNATHMGFENIDRLTRRLYEIDAIDDRTVKFVNHFSHNGNPLCEVMERKAAEHGFSASHDGLSVEF